MKKMLLLLVCLTTFAWLHADEVTFDFSKAGYSNEQVAPSVEVNQYIKITYDKGTNNNPPKYYNTGTGIRLYGGNRMTFTCTGATLQKIVFTTASSNGSFNKGSSSTIGTFTYSTKTWTPLEDNTTETTITNGGTSGHVRIQKVAITYTVSGSATQVATPVITPASGAVEAGTKVTISCSDTEAEIHYTTNGDDPTAKSAIYTAETDITVNEAMTVKAIAVKAGLDNSNIATAEYTIKKTTAANIAEFISLASTNDVYAILNPVTAVYQNGQNLYVKDSSGWLLVFGDLGKTYANGDEIAAGIKGTSEVFKGTYELSNPDASTFAEGVAGTPVEPEEVTSISADIVNHYVVVKGVTISGISGKNGKATTADATEIALYNKFGITGFEAGSNLTIKGFVNEYDKTQLLPIEITNAAGEEIVAAPTFNPAAGEVEAGTKVEIDCKTADAKIYYTTDETDPTESSTLYDASTGIIVNEAMTIKAIAVKEGLDNSAIASATYTIKKPVVATPTFDPAPGAVAKGTEVTITCATEGATLMYQVNGGDIQVGESPVTVVINVATTIDVIASKDGYVDSEATAVYSIEGEAPANPTATFDFTQPSTLQPAMEMPTNTSPTDKERAYVDNVVFYNNYALVQFISPADAPGSNRTQLWPYSDAAQVRAYAGSTIKITVAESLTIEKIEFVGATKDAALSAIKVADGYTGTYSVNGTTATWIPAAVNALAETVGERESVVFSVTGKPHINTITITTTGIPTGVEDVTVDENAPVEYYNLQGVRVDNPENGIYIRRQGSKVSKVLVR